MHTAVNFASTAISNVNDLNNLNSSVTIDVVSNSAFGLTFPIYCVIGQLTSAGLIDKSQPHEFAEIESAPSGQLTLSRTAAVALTGTPTIMAAADARSFNEAATEITTLQSSVAGKAASGANTDITSLASPAIGAATATTQAPTDNSTYVATTAFVRAAGAFIGARIVQSTGQTIPNATWTALTFAGATPNYDTSAFFSSANPTRLTVPAAGYYIFGSNISPPSASRNGEQDLRILLNSGGVMLDAYTLAFAGEQNGVVTALDICGIFHFNAGDYIEGWLYQSSGGSYVLPIVGSATPCLWIARIGI